MSESLVYPSKLIYFNEYFDEDTSSYPRQNTRVEMCQFTNIPLTRFGVSFLLQNFSEGIFLDLTYHFGRLIIIFNFGRGSPKPTHGEERDAVRKNYISNSFQIKWDMIPS